MPIILFNPDKSKIFLTRELILITETRPPSLEIFLYLPMMTPIPEESIKLIEDAEEKLILKKEMLDTFNNVNDDENYKKVYVKFLEDRFKKIKDIYFEIIYK